MMTTHTNSPATLTSACWLAALGAAMLLSASGCGEEPVAAAPVPQEFKIEVQVTDTSDNAVPRVPVLVDGTTVGRTDRDGKFLATLKELPGQELEVAVGEIEGYRFVTESKKAERLRVQTNVAGERQGLPISLYVKAESIQHDYLVWVNLECDDTFAVDTPCAEIPVLLNGETVATTDRYGSAHFTFKGVTGHNAKLALATPDADPEDDASPKYRPAKPEYDLELLHGAGIFVIDEKLSDANAEDRKTSRTRRGSRARRPAASRTGSARSKAASKPSKPAQKKPAKKKEEKGKQIIDLW